MKKVKSSTIVEVVAAMIILCIVVLLTYSFLISSVNRDRLSVYDLVSTTSDCDSTGNEDFDLTLIKQYKISYNESVFGDNLLEVEVVYYNIEGKVLCRRCWLKYKD